MLRQVVSASTFAAVLASFSFDALASNSLQGRWEGQYSCNGMNDNNVILSLTPSAKGALEGVLEFRLTDSRQGSYTIVVRTNNWGNLLINPLKWIKRARGVNAISFEGKLSADGARFEGKTSCRIGHFKVARTGDAKPPANLPLSQNAPQNNPPKVHEPRKINPGQTPEEWAAAIRSEMARLVKERDQSNRAWMQVKTSITVRPRQVPLQLGQQLFDEYLGAMGEVKALILFDQLDSGQLNMANGGFDKLLAVVRSATRAKDWPKATVERIRETGRTKAVALLRPELEKAAAMTRDLGASLESLIKVRSALAELENYRPRLIELFGTADPDDLLRPLLQRIVEIEKTPAVEAELRAALEQARQQKDPRRSTEELLYAALGPEFEYSSLNHLVPEARLLAAIAAIQIVDRSQGGDQHEPSAKEIAQLAYARVVTINTVISQSEIMCREPEDGVSAALCLPLMPFILGGGLEARLVGLDKLGCISETRMTRYKCQFVQKLEIVYASMGPLAPNLVDALEQLVPGGFPEEASSALFERSAGGSWQVTWAQ